MLLLVFEAMLGLRVKSVLIPIGKVPELQHMARLFGCGIDYLPLSYLCLPCVNFKSKVVWDPIVERVNKKLAGWKSKLLSKGGRLTLLKITL